ncbi:diguanylate cyclase domain-containing protein [Haploplasma modicum]|uniref:diguanylate cyclase domain-containing protein n=1 Tax=Haploplasma modicum TaxID=2150 RepID=UPI00138ABB46|nr:diguanylate cyclase [Haploplasma modicum]
MGELLIFFSRYYLIVLNMSVIIVFASLVNLLNPELESKGSKIGLSLIISGIIIIIMSSSYRFGNIYYFDSRSIVLGISGAFFGPAVSILPFITAIIVRLFIGGTGTYMGVFEIVYAILIGIVWQRIMKNSKYNNKLLKATIFSLIVNLFSLSGIIFFGFYNKLSATVFLTFIIYQILNNLIGIIVQILLYKFNEKKILIKKINHENRLLNQIVNIVEDLEIYTLDSNYNYLGFNDHHKIIMRSYSGSNIKVGDNFFKLLDNHPKIASIQKSFLETALEKGEYHSNLEIKEHNLFYEEYYYLIKNNDEVIGTSVFSRNITNDILQTKEVEYLSYHDGLTGFYNRSFFNIYSKKFDTKKECSVIYLDVNGLKFFNDAFGHNVGDQLLILVSDLIKEAFTDSLTFRIGGDEILIISETNNHNDFELMLEKMEDSLKDKTVKNISISVSSGIVRKSENQSLDEALKEAEDKMYYQKLMNSNEKQIENYLSIIQSSKNSSKKKKNVLKYTVEIGRELKFSEDELMNLKLAATVYDIGKIGLDKEIKEEFKNTNELPNLTRYGHTVIGFRILQTSKAHLNVAYDVLSCHENYDGTGFPQNLKGENIPINARIIRLADYVSNYFDVEKSEINDIIDKLLNLSNVYFDPKITKSFIKILKRENRSIK